ncbi:hypothetical protein F511_15229 [Dorcoceras hygrometricum]|uniref:Two-component response regulator n=1 Tax=Dorcoceras hygrometricum TaxID=472368 RepID=A0A2Z7D1G3_9LAMI|nr:hypothetical protein F511_15229 [Dorcoceras hygrometricum]
MSCTRSTGSWKSSDGVPHQFPAGLRVLVVDDDSSSLLILERMLLDCLYEVTKCELAEAALQLLREKKDGFDIVMSDVHMPDMDGFKLLEQIRLEMDLPVIMMSTDDTKELVMKGVRHGACDYLVKPVRMDALKNMWQHVIRRKKCGWKEKNYPQQSGSVEDGDQLRKSLEDIDYSSSPNEGHLQNTKRRKDDKDDIEERNDIPALKKPRVVWSIELHQQFETAVNQLGVDNAVPKKILEIMNVPGLTRENVASHLQKYRVYLKRINSRNGQGNSFMKPPGAAFAATCSIKSLDLQALAASDQLPHHCVNSIPTPSLGTIATTPAMSVIPTDQTKILSLKNLNMRFTEGQQPNCNVKQVSMLHGVPTNMNSKQLATLHQAAHVTYGNMNLHSHPHVNQNNLLHTQMVQQQPSAQISNGMKGAHLTNLPSVSQPQTIPNAAVLGGKDFSRPAYSVSQPSTFAALSSCQRTGLPGNSFSLVRSSGVSTLTSKGLLPEVVNSEVKGHQCFLSNFDTISDQNHHHRNQDWVMHQVGSTLEARQHPNFQLGMDTSPTRFFHPGFSLDPKNVQSKTGFSVADGMDNQQNDGDLLSVKAEKFGEVDLFPESIDREDFMTIYNKQASFL